MPRSASLSASTSLTPSPVIATTCPRAWSAWTMRCFCRGSPARTPSGPAPPRPHRARSPPARSSRASEHRRPRTRSRGPSCSATAPTVTGLSPEITFRFTSWSRKYAPRLRDVALHPLVEQHQRDRVHVASARRRPGHRRPGQQEDADPACRVPGHDRQHRVVRSERTSGAPSTSQPTRRELSRRPLPHREKGTIARSAVDAGLGTARRSPSVSGCGCGSAETIAASTASTSSSGVDGKADHVDAGHLGLGERACLVDAEHVDPGQPLDGRQLLHEEPAAAEPDDPDGEGDARQEHEALGEHRDDPGDSAHHRRRRAGVGLQGQLATTPATLRPAP